MLRKLALMIVCSVAITGLGCGPSSPEAQTEAQVMSDGSWSGTFGDLGQISGSGNSGVLEIGRGRQCAVVTKIGSGNINVKSSMTLRVADDTEVASSSEFTVVRTACGTGPLR